MFTALKSASPSLVTFVVVLNLLACSGISAEHRERNDQMATKTIEEVLEENCARLLSLPGVLGTAQGLCDERPCIKIYVREKTPRLMEQIPDSIGGFTVEVEETGEIKALPEERK